MSIIGIFSDIVERVRALLFRSREERELDEELRFHVEKQTEANVRSGMDEKEARRQALLKLGGVEQTKEEVRSARGTRWLEDLVRDASRGVRRLIRQPSFSAPLVLTLALGIGATTAIFSVVDATLLRPLPFERDDRLVRVDDIHIPTRFPEDEASQKTRPGLVDVDSLDHLFTQVTAYASGSLNLTGAGEPRRVAVTLVTPSFFSTLGVQPGVGRPFTVAEGTAENARVAILSHGVWRSRFGADSAVVGRAITLNGIDHRVVGVMPAGFAFPAETEVWTAMPVPMTPAYWEPFGMHVPSNVVARLAPGVTVGQAGERVLALMTAYAPDDHGPEATAAELVVPLRDVLVRQRRTALLVLMGATALMLLIACANAANLMLARAARRRRELALQTVLGATSGRIIRQLLVESMIVALAGGALGIVIAFGSVGALEALIPSTLVSVASPAVDLRVLGFAFGIAVASGVGFGIWPALRARSTDAGEVIKSGHGRGATAHEATRLRRAFVVTQVALALVLLIGAGIMLRSFRAVLTTDPGLNPRGVATAEVSLADARYGTPAERRRFYDGVLARLRSASDVEAAALVNELPLRDAAGVLMKVSADDATATSDGRPSIAQYITVTPEYFTALGVPLVRGRTLGSSAGSGGPREVVINRELARRLWPGENPIGRRLRFDGEWTVVGVVGDLRTWAIDETRISPQMYLPLTERTSADVAVVARGTRSSRTLPGRLAEAVRTVDPAQAVYNLRTMEDVIERTVAPRRTTTMLVGTFGLLALLIAAVGIYGVISFGAARRRAEIGIRTALGARPTNVIGLIMREGVALTVIGAAIGVGVAWALSRVLESLVYEVSAQDPVSFVVAPVVLIAVALLATLVPARRATRIDPLESIRAE